MTELNASIRDIPIPWRMASRPISPKGYPVPWFVAWLDGLPDFRVIAPGRIAQAHKGRLCWLCGQPLGRFMAFTIGPMCAINRVSAEPPSHRECAEYAAVACPFLSQPKMRRNTADMPEEHEPAPGVAIMRNPGVALVWVTKSYKVMRVENGALFQVGDPTEVKWFCHGRPATRVEVMASISSGLPLLEAEAIKDGPEAVAELARYVDRAMPLLPAG